MAEQGKISGKDLGAYGVILTPKGFMLIEKPGKNRGLELPGGHGEDADIFDDYDAPPEVIVEESLKKCFAREAMEEVGVCVDPDSLMFIEEPRVLPTHTTAIFFTELSKNPKTVKTEGKNKDGKVTEIVHIVKPRDIRSGKLRFFPPHFKHIQTALNMLDASDCKKN